MNTIYSMIIYLVWHNYYLWRCSWHYYICICINWKGNIHYTFLNSDWTGDLFSLRYKHDFVTSLFVINPTLLYVDCTRVTWYFSKQCAMNWSTFHVSWIFHCWIYFYISNWDTLISYRYSVSDYVTGYILNYISGKRRQIIQEIKLKKNHIVRTVPKSNMSGEWLLFNTKINNFI